MESLPIVLAVLLLLYIVAVLGALGGKMTFFSTAFPPQFLTHSIPYIAIPVSQSVSVQK